jgi:hypothetical protein
MSYLWSLGAGTAGNLVQWTGQPAAEATWIDLEEFQRLYHDFQLEDELLVGGGDVMIGVQYTRRRHGSRAPKEPRAPDGVARPHETIFLYTTHLVRLK